jgi:hypothetical protein
MIVTNGSAKYQWCPFARTMEAEHDGTLAAAATNRLYETGAPRRGTMCLGDKCMAWQWKDPDEKPNYRQALFQDDPKAIIEPPRPAGVPHDWEWRGYLEDEEIYEAAWCEPEEAAEERFDKYRKGFCGLAAR